MIGTDGNWRMAYFCCMFPAAAVICLLNLFDLIQDPRKNSPKHGYGEAQSKPGQGA